MILLRRTKQEAREGMFLRVCVCVHILVTAQASVIGFLYVKVCVLGRWF